MSKQSEIERFTQEVVNNEAFREQLKSLGSDHEAVIKVANANGYDFTLDDMKALVPGGELSDSQLDGVAGGVMLLFDRDVFLSGTPAGHINAKSGTFFIW